MSCRDLVIESVYEKTMAWLIASEERFLSNLGTTTRKQIKAETRKLIRWDEDNAWGYYIHPSPTPYLRRVAKKLELSDSDILIDIGAGDARLCMIAIQEFGIRKAYAVELNRELCELAMEAISGTDLEGKIFIYSMPYQLLDFPPDITKAAFIAWHNGPKTYEKVLSKLRASQCKLFLHNFGDPKKLIIERIREAIIGRSTRDEGGIAN